MAVSGDSRNERAQALQDEAREFLCVGESKKAVAMARAAGRLTNDPVIRGVNLGAMLIDAGSDLRRTDYVRQGLKVLQAIHSSVPTEKLFMLHHNLGTGHLSIGQRQRGLGPGTRPSLSLAVSYFDESLKLLDRPATRTNLANALLLQGRIIEALDEFEAVLTGEPDFHCALANRGAALERFFGWTANHRELLEAAAIDYGRALELASNEPVYAAKYRRVLHELRRRVEPHHAVPREPTQSQAWIWKHRLALNPCPICRIENPAAFDIYPLSGRLKSPCRRPPTEELLNLVNTICQTYATNRWLLYQGLRTDWLPETGHVISVPVSKEAQLDLQTGLVMSAFLGFYRVLSQIASGMNAAFGLGHAPERVTIDTVWWSPQSRRPTAPPGNRKDLHPKLRRGQGSALAALYALALSLSRGKGRYSELRDLRNSLEHRVVTSISGGGEHQLCEAVKPQDLERQTIRLGRLARAAIWYFSGALLRGEQRRLRRILADGKPVRAGRGTRVQRL